MGKRVRITNSSLNDLGTRVLTSGVDIGQYRRNRCCSICTNAARSSGS